MITVEIVHGHAFVSSDDIRNARNAAIKVLQEAGVAAEIACAEFIAQLGNDEIYERTGVAAVWERAEEAANDALNADGLLEHHMVCVIYV